MKRLEVDGKVFESVNDTAKYLQCSPAGIDRALKEGRRVNGHRVRLPGSRLLKFPLGGSPLDQGIYQKWR